jgi:hypothetical protein
MPAGLMYDGILDGSFGNTPEMEGIVAINEGVGLMWVYEASERWIGEGDDREFRGYFFTCRNPDGEAIEEMPGYQVRQV